MIRAVIFDMDGLLLDSEVYWEQARRAFCQEQRCEWTPEDELGVKGYNSPEWAARIADRCGLSMPRDRIIQEVEGRMRALYDEHLPLLPCAVETVRSAAARYPLAIASSSPPELIEHAIRKAEIRTLFAVVVSADTVGKGKPAPDVFLEAATRLEVLPRQIAVFEDSTAGIRASRAAGMYTVAVPNPHYPPEAATLEQADLVLDSLCDFRLEMLPPER